MEQAKYWGREDFQSMAAESLAERQSREQKNFLLAD